MTPNGNNGSVSSTPVNETTPLVQTSTHTVDDNGSVISNSSWYTIQYGQPTDEKKVVAASTTTNTTTSTGVVLLEDHSETSKRSTATFDHQSIQHSIRSLRDKLVRAHSKLEEMIHYHTGTLNNFRTMNGKWNKLRTPHIL